MKLEDLSYHPPRKERADSKQFPLLSMVHVSSWNMQAHAPELEELLAARMGTLEKAPTPSMDKWAKSMPKPAGPRCREMMLEHLRSGGDADLLSHMRDQFVKDAPGLTGEVKKVLLALLDSMDSGYVPWSDRALAAVFLVHSFWVGGEGSTLGEFLDTHGEQAVVDFEAMALSGQSPSSELPMSQLISNRYRSTTQVPLLLLGVETKQQWETWRSVDHGALLALADGYQSGALRDGSNLADALECHRSGSIGVTPAQVHSLFLEAFCISVAQDCLPGRAGEVFDFLGEVLSYLPGGKAGIAGISIQRWVPMARWLKAHAGEFSALEMAALIHATVVASSTLRSGGTEGLLSVLEEAYRSLDEESLLGFHHYLLELTLNEDEGLPTAAEMRKNLDVVDFTINPALLHALMAKPSRGNAARKPTNLLTQLRGMGAN